jgi:hypothetical protein
MLRLPSRAGMGPNPTLPEPAKTLLPTLNIALHRVGLQVSADSGSIPAILTTTITISPPVAKSARHW